MIRTAFEKDSNSEQAELFLLVKDYIKACIGNGVKEKFNKNTTSFYIKEGGVCSIKVKDDFIYVNWFQGAYLNDKFNLLKGKGNLSKNQKIYNLDIKMRETIRYYIKESFIRLVELDELKKIRKTI